MRCGHLHTAEFIKFEVLLVYPYALLREEYRAWVINFDRDDDYKEKPRKQDQSHQTQQNIECWFYNSSVHYLYLFAFRLYPGFTLPFFMSYKSLTSRNQESD